MELHSLFPGVPIMALTATATPVIASKPQEFFNCPLILSSTINIYLAHHPCNFKKTDGPSKCFGLDHRDFNNFADKVSFLIGNE